MLRRRLLVLIVLLSCLGGVVHADDVDEYVAARMREFHIPGLSLAVVRRGEIVKVKGYGLADVARRTDATPETVYRIGSVSKQFIATGVMLLVQRGQVALDDPVSKYLDDTPSAWRPITIRHLLTHTSGIVREAPGFDPFKTQSDADVIRTAYDRPLRFEPGAKWEYCNVGYFMLAEIIRKVSGQPWTDFLQEQVFRAHGMQATWPTNTTARVDRRATGYGGNDNVREAPNWTALRPSGAFLSTVLDLAKWERALDREEVLTAASRREMWAPVRLIDGATHPYGFGWELGSLNGSVLVQHGGSMPGFRARYARVPDDRLAVIVLTNAEDVDLEAIVRGIAELSLPVRR
jgi:D-alanyl-D-alanine carboxypeptidase